MTNTEDLRKGNAILTNAEGLPVIIIEVEENAVLLESFPENSLRLKNHIYGITLTTEMLTCMSFNDDKTKNSWCGQGITLHLKEDGIFYGLRLLRNRTRIQYLHQLQNYISDYHIMYKDQKRLLRFKTDNLLQHFSSLNN